MAILALCKESMALKGNLTFICICFPTKDCSTHSLALGTKGSWLQGILCVSGSINIA